MNEFREFLDKLGIPEEGTYTDDDEYVIEFEDSNKQSKIFSALEKSNELGLDEDEGESDFGSYKLRNLYRSDSYEVEFESDFENDKYKLTVRKMVED